MNNNTKKKDKERIGEKWGECELEISGVYNYHSSCLISNIKYKFDLYSEKNPLGGGLFLFLSKVTKVVA